MRLFLVNAHQYGKLQVFISNLGDSLMLFFAVYNLIYGFPIRHFGNDDVRYFGNDDVRHFDNDG